MAHYFAYLSASVVDGLTTALGVLMPSLLFFVSLALLLKGREALAAFERAFDDVRMNLSIHVLDVLLVAPGLAILAQLVQDAVATTRLVLITPSQWELMPHVVTLFAAVFIGDFVSFGRHRLEHTRLLWPTHAIHHSDAHMSWLTIVRFHPINRASTLVIDLAILAALGFPKWALIANFVVRHYYGEFIHADLPWTYGPLRYVFVSPAMHRWHHARDVVGAGSNFATVFAVFDYAFGTFHVPGLCTVPLGVNDDMGKGTIGQMLYPLKAWRQRLQAVSQRDRPSPVERTPQASVRQ